MRPDQHEPIDTLSNHIFYWFRHYLLEASTNRLVTNKVYVGTSIKGKKMKFKDLREVVMRMIDDGMTSVEIAEQLRNVVSQRTVRRWSDLYKETGAIHLKK